MQHMTRDEIEKQHELNLNKNIERHRRNVKKRNRARNITARASRKRNR